MRGRLGLAVARGLVRKRVVIGGDRSQAEAAVLQLSRARATDVEIVGVFCCETGTNSPDGYLADLIQYGTHHPVDWVLLALDDMIDERIIEVVNQLKIMNVHVGLCTELTNPRIRHLCLVELGGVPVVVLTRRPIDRGGLILKAVEDRVLAMILLLMIFPLMIIIAIAVRLHSPGPVLFRQRRHGLNNVEFEIFKFRTMIASAGDSGQGLEQTRRNDARITRLGQFLRRSSLDELPQLFNVLRGEMSMVGPRPHPISMRTQNKLGSEIVTEYRQRHRVKPGITGWAQINGHRGATETTDQLRRRVEYDMYYIDNWSILFDLKILALTPIRMLADNVGAF